MDAQSQTNENQSQQPKQQPTLFPFDSSESIAELMDAFSKAQGEFPQIPKDSKVDVYSKPPDRRLLYTYYYAELTTIIDCTRPSLTKNGLSFTQDYTVHKILGPGICTIIFHKSGQWIKMGFVPCAIKGADMKDIAGQFTYGKRISLTAALGVSADEDVDAGSDNGNQGNETEKKPANKKQDPKPKNYAPGADNTPPKETKPEPKINKLYRLVKEKNLDPETVKDMIKKATGTEKKSTDLSETELDTVIKFVAMK